MRELVATVTVRSTLYSLGWPYLCESMFICGKKTYAVANCQGDKKSIFWTRINADFFQYRAEIRVYPRLSASKMDLMLLLIVWIEHVFEIGVGKLTGVWC